VLSLASSRWAELRHAYGSANDTPALLRQLHLLPASKGNAEPWFTLWSSLAHQGDVYSASFAAVPHVIEALAIAPAQADASYFHFPAWVEICRVKSGIEVPDDLQAAYFSSLARLPTLVALAAERQWEPEFLACALAAVAPAKGQTAVAEAVLEFTSARVAEEFMEWVAKQ
jgi:hypothetical protein